MFMLSGFIHCFGILGIRARRDVIGKISFS